MDYAHVSILLFIYYLIKYQCWHQVVKQLENTYQADNFKVTFLLWTLWIIQTRDEAKQVLSSTGATDLTWANQNFFTAHYYPYGIGNIQQNNELWKPIHNSLAKAIDLKHLEKIMHNKQYILHKLFDEQLPVNDILEQYIVEVWGEFCFGANIDQYKYKQLQTEVIETLRLTFYNHRSTILLPVVGTLFSKCYRYYYQSKFTKIDQLLDEMLTLNSKSFFNRFKSKLEEQNVPDILIDKIVKDNAFLSPLVFDFIYIFLLETIIPVSYTHLRAHETSRNLV